MKTERMRFAISPHEKAPMFLEEKNPELLVAQALSETASLQTTESVRQLIKQTALVNLWFFEKVVAGYNGPFDKLTDTLHLDMANFCQDYALVPGSSCAVAAPRFHFKTTVCTTGFDAWKLIREPDRSIRLHHAVYTKATEYLHIIQRIFDSNEFFAWLFGNYAMDKESFCPRAGQKIGNDEMLFLPLVKDGGVRTRHLVEGSISCGSVGGTGQGSHSDDGDFDDVAGETDLTVDHASGIDMYRKKDWLQGARRALLKSWIDGRVFVKFTRYAPDDVYEPIMTNAKKIITYDDTKLDPRYVERENGEWIIYYRFVKENDKIIFPERVTQEILDKTLEDDPWFYYTQLENNPYKSGIAELTEYRLKPFTLDFEEERGWIIQYEDVEGKSKTVLMADCDVVQAADPAATDRNMRARTSKSAQGVVAHASDDKRFICGLHTGYVAPQVLFGWLFEDYEKFKNYMRVTLLEAQGPFKILGPIIRLEEQRKNVYLNLRPVSAVGDKDARIRSTLHPILERKNLYCRVDLIPLVNEELKSFPGGAKKDILDMLTLALSSTTKPMSAEELAERAESGERRKSLILNAAGYMLF